MKGSDLGIDGTVCYFGFGFGFGGMGLCEIQY